MPRAREFDEDEALDRAMYLFWQKGFADTSVRDLVEHTGVAHAGLYSAFKDKETLYLRSLEKYAARQNAYVFGPMEEPGAGLAEIEGVFAKVSAGARNGQFRRGCFIANSAVTFMDGASHISEFVRRNYRRQVSAFRNALKNAVNNREVRPELEVNKTAGALTACFYGLSSLSRAGVPAPEIEAACEAAVSQLK